MNESCFVFEQLEGWTCILLRWRKLRAKQVLRVGWVKLELPMRHPRGVLSGQLDI